MLARPVPISGDILQGFVLSFIHHSPERLQEEARRMLG